MNWRPAPISTRNSPDGRNSRIAQSMTKRHQPLRRIVRKVCLRLTLWGGLLILVRSEENFWIAVFAAIYLYIAGASARAQQLTEELKTMPDRMARME